MKQLSRATLLAGWIIGSTTLVVAGGACSQPLDKRVPTTDVQAPRATKLVEVGCVGCPTSAHRLAPRSLMLAGNEVWLLDAFAPHVRVFNLNGQELRTFGRGGEGPGELNLPVWLGQTAAGEMLIYNGLPAKLMRLNPLNGELMGTTPLTARALMNITLHSASETLYRLSFTFGGASEILDRLDITSGKSTVLLPDQDAHPSLPGTEDGPLMDRRFPITALGDGGFAVGDAWVYIVRTYDRDGEPGATIKRDLPRPKAPRLAIADFEPDAELPHFGKFALDYDTTHDVLWVMTHRGLASDETVFDLFTPDGALIGSLALPVTASLDFKSFDAAGDKLITWSGDDNTRGILTVWSLEWNK